MSLTPFDPDDLERRVHEAMDRRLEHNRTRPVALALSGGGDSAALLHLASGWARRRGRRLLAITVDHELNPDSAAWTAAAGVMARRAGVDWRPLVWAGPKPDRGLSAEARAARHALIARAARDAGARVILFAHTADDIAEADWMRARGSTLGRLRDWTPSPVWPDGRDLMLCRPLLGERRETLRRWLTQHGHDWLDDPANDDPRFARARARQALAGQPSTHQAPDARPAINRDQIVATRFGQVTAARGLPARALAAALVCVGGGTVPPRADRLARLMARVAEGEDFVASLAGARIEAQGDRLALCREPGEFRRRPPADLPLEPGVPVVWDGRFEIVSDTLRRIVTAAAGRRGALSGDDRACVAALTPAVRAGLPVLIRDAAAAPVLAWREARVRSLVGARLRLALDQTTHENDLDRSDDGGTPSNHLFQMRHS